jgi:uncharacterized protein
MTSIFHSHSPVRIFFVSGLITITALGLVLGNMGWQAALVALMLVIIELTFSFDNAIINARILMTMSPFWQKMFMTVGILIAVFGMRIVFPIVIVMMSSGLPPDQVVQLAFNNPDKYAEVLHKAHPSIAAFGGMFLLMLALHFFFDVTRDIQWIKRVERPMQAVGRKWLHALVCTILLIIIVLIPANKHPQEVLTAGLVGIGIYLLIHGASELFTLQRERQEKATGKKILQQTGMAAFASFLYLEVLDASFSFDGVIGAFAVTKDVILIAVGLGIGALWVRSLTLFIVRRKVLTTYRYLEHAAHYVIAALAGTLLLGIFFEFHEALVGLVGLVVIGIAIAHSIRDNKKEDLVTLK